MDFKKLLLVFVASIGISFALYGNTIGGEFVYDDVFFTHRPELHRPQALLDVWRESYFPYNPTAAAYRPLPLFTFALNFLLFGDSPVSFHVTNILLNGIVVFLVFLVVWKLFQNKILAIFTALIFAFLPIHTEAVAFIKARDDILATLFSLLSWVLFLNATARKKIAVWGVVLSSVFWVVALLGKEIAIVMPALFLLVFWIKKRATLGHVIKVSSLFIPAALLYFLLRFMVLGNQFLARDSVHFIFNPLREADFATLIWTAFKIAFIYIGKTFVPVHLTATYSYNHLKLVSNPFSSLETLLGVLLLGVLIFFVIYKRTRNTLGVGALLFLLPYMVLSKFFVQLSEIASEKWMYLPSIGLSLIAGFVLYHVFQYKKQLGISLLIAILAVYTPIVIQRNTVWASKESLAKSMVRDAPDSAYAHLSLAEVYYEQGKYKESKTAIAQSLQIFHDFAPSLNMITLLALKEGRGNIAGKALKATIELRAQEYFDWRGDKIKVLEDL